MKAPFLILFLAAGLLAQPAVGQTRSAQRAQINQLFKEGRAAFYRGDFATARNKLSPVLRALPNHQPTIIMMKNIELAEKEAAAKANSLEGRMRQMSIPQLTLEEAPVSDVLSYIQTKAAELSGDKPKPNFIINLDESSRNRRVTMRLGEISLHDALSALATTAGLDVTYEKYAIVVRPRGAEAPIPAETGKPQ